MMKSRLYWFSYFKAVAKSHLNLRLDGFPNLLVKAPKMEEHLLAVSSPDIICPTEQASQSLSSPLCREGNAQVRRCQSD